MHSRHQSMIWIGEPCSLYNKLTNIMAQLKPILSPKTSYAWAEELGDAFTCSKVELIKVIKQGVRIFNTHQRTCLNSDWLKTGITYWLQIKYCNCDSATPGSCDDLSV